MSFRRIWIEYKTEFVFGLSLIACVVLSLSLTHLMPVQLYNDSISHILDGCIATVSLSGAWLMARHTNGMRIRKIWVLVLLVHAIFSVMLLMHVTSFVDVPKRGFVSLRGWEMVAGNFLIWLLLLYPTEVLRPGRMNVKRALLQGLPVAVAYALDKLFAIDLRVLLAIYPMFLFAFLIARIREYRRWCEENYSSMDNIDVQWIVRYIIMYLLDCGLFFALCFSATVPVALTQQWLLIVIIGYSTEQILFRRDPWTMVQSHKATPSMPEEEDASDNDAYAEAHAEYRAALENWMATDKPYLNTEFRLMDLREVLPMNRTYLSQFINAEYGCNFYQFVTGYRIEEAKRLMREHPEMQLQDVAEQSGFSLPTVFSRIFSREVGMTPRDWGNQN